MDIIDYRNVEVRQEDMFVLGDVTFTVQEGDFVYLIGKVGSGKSSLFKTLYCEIDVLCPMPDSHAIVLGMDLMTIKKRQIPRLRRQMGIVFQDFQLLTDRNEFRAQIHRLERQETHTPEDIPGIGTGRYGHKRLQDAA